MFLQPETCHVVRVLSVKIDSDYSRSYAISRLPQSVYELPTCPVCLERMDSAVTGLITVPCSHTFHCMCLSKWGDSRYAATANGNSLLVTYVFHKVSRLSIFTDSSLLTSHVVHLALTSHPVFECFHPLSFYVRRLLFLHELMDLSYMRQYWLWPLRPRSRARTLRKDYPSLCPRA